MENVNLIACDDDEDDDDDDKEGERQLSLLSGNNSCEVNRAIIPLESVVENSITSPTSYTKKINKYKEMGVENTWLVFIIILLLVQFFFIKIMLVGIY